MTTTQPLTRHAPTQTYSGLTVILEKPSRFDTEAKLISAVAGDYFDKIIRPYSRAELDIRTIECRDPLLPNTKVLLLLGQGALDAYKPGGHSLLTHRGSPHLTANGLITIPTITPQDAFDRKNYENPEEDDEDGPEKSTEKDHQKTSRANYRFWFTADVAKAIRYTREGGVRQYPPNRMVLCPPTVFITEQLNNFKDGYIILDIETNKHTAMTVFSFLLSQTKELDYSGKTTYEVITIPFIRYNNTLFYGELDYCHIFRALTLAFSKARNNTIVCHNGMFDLFILMWKYFINPPAKPYDTMLAHHRCHPEIEKSLGHVISYYLDLPYHKDEGVFNPRSSEQETKLWKYNAKDVWTTFLVFCEQQKEIDSLKARSSVDQANRSIRPLLGMQFEGCLADTKKMCSMVDEATFKYEQILRLLKLFTGRAINPRSPIDVPTYLYDTLRLPVIAGKKKKDSDSEKTTRSAGEEVLLKLYLKHPIPSIRLILEARKIGKQASSLKNIRMWGEKGNRLTCSYKLTTETFRLKSSELLSFNLPASEL